MAGRPRRAVTEQERGEVLRLQGLGLGARRIARRAGLPRWLVEQLVSGARARRPWQDSERTYLRTHAGTHAPSIMAAHLDRSAKAVRDELGRLGISVVEARQPLSASLAAALIGRDVGVVLRAIGRQELPAHHAVGEVAWRIWPVDLRTWVLADKERADPARVRRNGLWTELAGLLADEWGQSPDEARKRARRARQACAETEEDA